MLRNILAYGIFAGLIVGIPLTAMTITGVGESQRYGMVIGYSIMLVALSLVFVGVKRQRDIAGGGVIGFLPALGMGLAISAIAGVFYVIAWESALAITHLDFGAVYAKAVIDAQRAKGVTGPELARITAEMAAFRVHYADWTYRLPMTFAEIFPVGVLVSLVSASLLRNRQFMPAKRE